MRDETKCLHAGYTLKNTEPRVVPSVQSTTDVYDSTEDVAVFDDSMKSLIYSRFGNPTVMAVEDKLQGFWSSDKGGAYRAQGKPQESKRRNVSLAALLDGMSDTGL